MGLLQNGYRHNLTGRLFGATSLDGANPSVHVYWGHRAAANRNLLAGQGITDSKASVPNGNLPHSAWLMPRKAGGMSSRSAGMSISTEASGLMGLPAIGSATITFTVPDVEGQLILSGEGAAYISFSTNTPDLTASIEGAGSASFSISSEGTLGALAFIEGDTSFSIGSSGSILPLDDSVIPVSGEASFSFSGSLTSYAIGNMEGTTDVQTELTVDGIVSGVLGATASLYNETGTIGNKINTASSGGVDLQALAEAVYQELVDQGLVERVEGIDDRTKFADKVMRNKRAITSDKRLVVYDIDNITPILSKVLMDINGEPISALTSGVLAQEEASSV